MASGDTNLYPIPIYYSDEETLPEKANNRHGGRGGRGRGSGRGTKRGEKGSLSSRGAHSLSDVRQHPSYGDDGDQNRDRGSNRGNQSETRRQPSRGRGYRGRERGRGDHQATGADTVDGEHVREKTWDRGINRRPSTSNDPNDDNMDPRNRRNDGNERSRGRGQRRGT